MRRGRCRSKFGGRKLREFLFHGFQLFWEIGNEVICSEWQKRGLAAWEDWSSHCREREGYCRNPGEEAVVQRSLSFCSSDVLQMSAMKPSAYLLKHLVYLLKEYFMNLSWEFAQRQKHKVTASSLFKSELESLYTSWK